MSTLLAVDMITNDLKELEANLKKQVKTKFKEVEWDATHSYTIEKDYRAWNVMMGANKRKYGNGFKSSSTRRCLDNSRHFNKVTKSKKKIGVTL